MSLANLTLRSVAGKSFQALRLIDRSRALSVAISLALVVMVVRANDLLTPSADATLIVYAEGMSGGVSAPVFSLVHHRPMEVCDTYNADKTASLIRLGERSRTVSRIGGIPGIFREYHAEARALLEQPCRSEWVWRPGSLTGHLYAQFARDATPAWLFARFGVTQAEVALLILAGGLLGAFAIGQLFFSLTRSNLLLLCAVVYVSSVNATLVSLFGFLTLKSLYAFSTAWLITLFGGDSSRRSALTWIVLCLAMAINLVGYLSIAYSAAFLTVGIALLTAGVAVIARPTRAKVLAFLAVTAMVGLGLRDCSSFAKRQLAPISVLNFASSGSFGEFALTTGFWTERPNPWSYPLGDLGVQAAIFTEPLIQEYAPATFEYQGFSQVGSDMFREMLLTHPFTYAESLCKRAMLLIVKLPTIASGIEAQAPGLLRRVSVLALVAGALTLMAAASKASWVVELPILMVMAWNFFGIELLTHLVHTHTNYFVSGIIELLIGVPFLLAIGGLQIYRIVRSRVNMTVVERQKARRRLLIAAVLMVVVVPYSLRQVRRELATFDIWYGPWLGVYGAHPVKDALLPDSVAAKVERLRAFGESQPGSISMYAAWTMSRLAVSIWPSPEVVGTRLNMTADEVAAQHRKAADLAVVYLRRAQTEAPDSPWIVAFAPILDPPSAIRLFPRALENDPDGIFAPYLARFLMNNVSAQPYGATFDKLTHRRLVRSAAIRPGFSEVPPVESVTNGVARRVSRELRVRLQPDGVLIIGPIRGYKSDRVKAFLFAAIEDGSVDSSLQLRTQTTSFATPNRILPVGAPSAYRFFEWSGHEAIDSAAIRIHAGAVGATFRVKDLYPLIENGRE